jgi:lipopolysaccharide transport protein LptA
MILRLNFILLILFITLDLNSYAFNLNNGEINIESNNLNVNTNAKTAEFIGNVVLQQNNVKVFSNKLLITTQSNEIEQIIFLNNVKFQIGNKIILGDKAEYKKSDNILKIINNIKYINNHDNEITGDLFTYNFNNKISKLSSDFKDKGKNKNKRVKAKFKISKDVGS